MDFRNLNQRVHEYRYWLRMWGLVKGRTPLGLRGLSHQARMVPVTVLDSETQKEAVVSAIVAGGEHAGRGTVVLVPGTAQSTAAYVGHARELSKALSKQVVCYDQRGHGKTTLRLVCRFRMNNNFSPTSHSSVSGLLRSQLL
jgi:pimeloyl-ACP methyl ester carboxylesterase